MIHILQTGIELQDNFSNILYGIVNSVNLAVSAMYDMQQAMNADIDTASLQGARDEINEATMAVNELNAALANMGTPQMPSPVSTQETVPVQWQSDNLDVFSTSGAERFQQEIRNANSMMQQLNITQARITQTAGGMDILPDAAVQDMNTMQQRLLTIQQRIQQIENNPVNMGTNQANVELERLRGQLDSAIQAQNDLNHAMQNMDVSAANAAYLRLSQTVSGTERYIRDNVDEQGRFNQQIQSGTQQANELTNMIKKAVGAYVSIRSIGEAINLSDTMTQTTARLNLIVDDGGSVEDLQNKIYESAQNSRSSYIDVAQVVSKLGLLAGDAFTSNDEMVAFAELMNKNFVIGGASASEQTNAMYQLNQAMASGRLQGDEYRSIIENAPLLAKSIEDYMRNVQGVEGEMKEWASEGLLTADVIKNAMFNSADEVNTQFESMPMTWSQIWQSMKNKALLSFQPVLQRLNDIANSEGFQTFANDAMEAMATLGNMVLNIFDLIGTVGGFIADNWSVISPIIYGVVAAFAIYVGWMTVYNTIQTISNGLKAISAARTALHTGATLAEAAATTTATGAQAGMNAALLACPLTWIIIMILAVIAVIYAVVAAINKAKGTSVSATGIIAGVFTTLAAHIINNFAIPAQNIIASLVNFIGNAFNDPVSAVKVLFYDMVLTVLGYIQNLAEGIETLINKIPGIEVDITSSLDKLYDGIEEAQQKVKDESGWVEYMEKWDYINYETAFDVGYEFGEGVDDKISNFLSDFFNKGKKGISDQDDSPYVFNESPYVFDNSGTESYLSNISDSTDDISDSLDITEEDLKYLRDIAEQEAVNRYTVAEINIDQSGMQNNINSGDDIDGFMTKLTDSVNEAVDNMTEGVHA